MQYLLFKLNHSCRTPFLEILEVLKWGLRIECTDHGVESTRLRTKLKPNEFHM